ncbi:hypothetical protein [Halorubrum saccharovorum]|uniref:hypothetical protein n=1 Tax=Halorubrum saccharovorum TaxID=2248 RepID=UPI0009B5B75C|nr:hypothetical protein [Halorubrum saccharovorum]
MNRRGLLAVVAVLALVGLVGTGSVIAFSGTGPAGVDGLLGDTSDPPALLHFESAGAHCPDNFMANSSTSVAPGAENTEITHSRNVSLPGPSYAIGGPTFERMNESTYVLNVPIEETEKAPRSCPGVARYNGTMRIPAGEDPWNLLIKHDGERVTTLHGDSNRSLLGGSTSVSGSASATDPSTNSTTSSE